MKRVIGGSTMPPPMNPRKRHPRNSRQRAAGVVRAVVLGAALLAAWLGLATQTPRAAASASTSSFPHVERPVAPGETCLSRSSREPVSIDARRGAERPASDPPKFDACPASSAALVEPQARTALRNASPARGPTRLAATRRTRGPPTLARA